MKIGVEALKASLFGDAEALVSQSYYTESKLHLLRQVLIPVVQFVSRDNHDGLLIIEQMFEKPGVVERYFIHGLLATVITYQLPFIPETKVSALVA